MKMHPKSRGFTIVELLIVIVVIAILATLTIVAYNGIQNNARAASLKSDLSQSVKVLDIYRYLNSEIYPANLAAAQTAGLKNSNANSPTYYYNSDSRQYCLEETNGANTYSVSSTNATPIPAPCTENSLVGWWKLDGNANDSSTGGNNGTVTSATLTAGQNGQANGAYSFNGSTSHISLADIDIQSYITVSAWVNPSTASQYSKIIAKHSGGGDVQGTLGLDNGNAQSETTTGGTYNNPKSATALPLGSWSLVTGVYDGSSSIVYVNGVSASSRAATGTLANNNLLWTIGSMPSFGGTFAGSIDDAHIYNRALTVAEIQSLYAASAQ